jgi:hypothetical protein
VPHATQDAANDLFADANLLFAQQQHAPAVEKYRAAIAIWDHPMIRYNLAVTLIRLGQALEAWEQLSSALRYHDKPFSKERYEQALDYKQLLEAQLGDIEVGCAQAGVKITLDGKLWFECPGAQRVRVVAGPHALVAEHPRFVTRAHRFIVTGGATTTENVALQTLEEAVVYEYPYRRWIPWTVAGGGAAVAGSGLLVWLAGRSRSNDARERSTALCPAGCTDAELAAAGIPDDFDAARLAGRIGISLMVAGALAGVTGAFFGIRNQPRRMVPTIDAEPRASGASMTATWRF